MRDYKNAPGWEAPRRRSRSKAPVLLFSASVVLLSAFIANTIAGSSETSGSGPLQTAHNTQKQPGNTRVSLELPLPVIAEQVLEEALPEPVTLGTWHEITIKRGDTLSSIFSKLEIHSRLGSLMSLGGDVKALNSIRPGQTLNIRIDDNDVAELLYQTNETEQLHVTRTEQGLQAQIEKYDYEVHTTGTAGTIEYSLFTAGQRAGLSDNLIMQLAGIFGWDVDFALDIRQGDSFTVVYEELYRDGEKVRDGNIIAAEFRNRGNVFRALRYTDSKGETTYYAPDGRSMRKPFLRTPVNFSRISSRFNLKRKHPVLNRIRAHKGVDYAAPTGTPVKASGDGKIVHRGRKGGYGNAVIIKHGTRYSTLYGHLTRFASKQRVGSRVKQGQTIGYVGKTGLATGPHLHYEFRVDGVHRNPLTVKFPAAKPLPESQIANFTIATQSQIAQLDYYGRALLAMNQHNN